MCALPTTLGRDSGAAAVGLDDHSVSRRHARLEIVDNELVLTDLGSTNGVRVNGRPVGAGPQPLEDGDRVELGTAQVTFEID